MKMSIPDCHEIMRIHSECVYQKALNLAKHSRYADAIDYVFLREAAMLHDYGILWVDAPDIGCHGTEPYMRHGILGAEYLRKLDGIKYARHARVCERHIGSGLTAQEIINGKMPLPARDFLPETFEEKLITYADNFYSKNPAFLREEKSWDSLCKKYERFGTASLERLIALHEMWEPRD